MFCLPVVLLESALYPFAVLLLPVVLAASVAFPIAVLALLLLPAPFPIVKPLTEISELNDLFPLTVWLVLRSTKFWVADPVPPFAIGNTPLYAVAVVLGVVQAKVPLPFVLKT